MAIRRGTWVWIIAVAVVVLLVGGYAAFAVFGSGTSAPAPVALSSAGPSASASPTSTASSVPGKMSGTWTVQGSDSFVGYRVREQFVDLPAPTDAVGRTSAVTGRLVIDGLSITAVDVKADLTQLQSDKSMRDGRMRTMGLETDTFPTAEFTLTEPIVFASRPAAGVIVKKDAKGTLDLHGVTKNVTIALQARWSGDQVEVVGTLPVQFADYGITPPSVGPITVEDHGTMELHLVFVQQG
jgi:polyisoprenoid-binding protein YceI